MLLEMRLRMVLLHSNPTGTSTTRNEGSNCYLIRGSSNGVKWWSRSMPWFIRTLYNSPGNESNRKQEQKQETEEQRERERKKR